MDSNSISSSAWTSSFAHPMDTEVYFLLISEIFETLALDQPLHVTLGVIATSVCTRLGFHSSAILLERSGEDVLLIEGVAGLSQSYVEAVNRTHPIHIGDLRFSEGPSSQAFQTGRPIVVGDTEIEVCFQRWRALARQQAFRSLISLPLLAHNIVIGTLNCYHREPHQYCDDEMQTLMMAAAQVGMAVEVARKVEAQQQTVGHLEEMTRELREQRNLLESSSRIHTTLTQLVLTNQGISAIAATLARFVGCPILVQDQFHQMLIGVQADGRPTTGLSALTQDMLVRRSLLSDNRDAQSAFELPALPKHSLDQPRAVAPIVAGQLLLGYVSTVLPSLPASPLLLRVLEQGSYVLAMEIVKDRLAHEFELRARRGFADDLVNGQYDDAKQVQDRGRYFGYDLHGLFQVLVIGIDSFDHYVSERYLTDADRDALHRRFFDAVQHVAKMHAPHVLVAGRHDRLAMILLALDKSTGNMAEQIEIEVRRITRQLLPDFSVSIGVGQIYPTIDHIRISHMEAGQALQVLHQLGGHTKTARYGDLGVARLLFQVENPAELVAFAHTRLGPLLTYDQHHNGILMTALEAYIMANQSIPQASQQLDLHQNTLRYRLQKIEQLLGTSLNSITLLLELHLASMILRLIDTSHNAHSCRT